MLWLEGLADLQEAALVSAHQMLLLYYSNIKP